VNTLKIRIEGMIRPGKTAPLIQRALLLDPTALAVIWIDSHGGNSQEADLILQALQRHDGDVHVAVSEAMSAASVIAMAGDKIWIGPQSGIMIHNPRLPSWGGTATELRAGARHADKVAAADARLFSKRTGYRVSQIRQWMDEETWFIGKQAVKHGFADEINPEIPESTGIKPSAVSVEWSTESLY